MSRYIVKRVLFMIPVLLGVTFIVFAILHYAPGDPAKIILGESAEPADIAQKRIELGLDDPLLLQFSRYIFNIVFHGDFGFSYQTGKPVLPELMQYFPNTLLLSCLVVVVMVIFGIPTGIISAVKQYSWVDSLITTISLLGVSMPTFWTGTLLTLLFCLKLNLLPATGFYGPSYWILPGITLGIVSAATLMRMTRSSMLDVIRQDYIRTARAKGQSEGVVIMHHALKNTMMSVITAIGLQFGTALGGAMIVETLFSIAGLGRLMVYSITNRNYPVVQGGVLLIAITYSVVNLIVDILYAFIDPRIKSQYQQKRKEGQV